MTVRPRIYTGPGALLHPLTEQSGRILLNLSVSETNKALLLKAEGFIPLLVDSLLLHPEHPRRAQVRKTPSGPLVPPYSLHSQHRAY